MRVGRCSESGGTIGLAIDHRSSGECETPRLTAAHVHQAGATVKPRRQEFLDIDDAFCAAHGGQQLAFRNTHHDKRGFVSMHLSRGERHRW
jgi:hypothetical protein